MSDSARMTSANLEISGLVKRFGGLIATDHLDLRVEENEVHALIGPNGAGKSTLVAQIQGALRPTSGTIRFRGTDITAMPAHLRAREGIARSFQITSIFPDFSVLANVVIAVQAQAGHSMRFWGKALHNPQLTGPAEELIELLGLSERAKWRAGDISHGERRQLELAMALALQPGLLLLDEPMAGMGRQDSARMIALLQRLKGRHTMVLVEHDMDAVFALADRISVLVAGRCIATGAPRDIKENALVRDAYLGHR